MDIPMYTVYMKDRGQKVTCSNLGQSVHLHDEVLLQAQEAHDGEEVDEDERQESRQQDGATVARDALYHIEQGLFPVDQIKQLAEGGGEGG